MRPPAARWSRRGALLTGLASPALARTTLAQPGRAWPERPIRLVVPFTAGGQTDVAARIVAEGVTPRLGQPVVIENRAGVSGLIGAQAVARAAPDGYTLLVGTAGTHGGLNAGQFPDLGYDPEKHFAPVAYICGAPSIMLTHSGIPARDLAGFIAWARANPDDATFGGAGTGTSAYMSIELLKQRAGLEMEYVPYSSSGQVTTDLMAARISFRAVGLTEAAPLRDVPQLRPLAITGARRNERWPDLPAVAETLPGFDVSSMSGVLAPAGTPPEVVARLNREINAAIATPAVQRSFADLGVEPGSGSPEEFHALMLAERAKWAAVFETMRRNAR